MRLVKRVAVRVKIRIRNRATGDTIETSALVNSGFEATTRKLLIPHKLATELKLWPPREVATKKFGTAGGEIGMPVIPESIEVKLVLERDMPWIICDAVISFLEREVLISDKLGGALGIVIEDLAEGIWRHREDGYETKRQTYPPQYWE